MAPSGPRNRLQQSIESKFQCQRCGNCCKGHGLVHADVAEVRAMAGLLGIKQSAFLRQYAIEVEKGKWILKDRLVQMEAGAEPEAWCIFLERGLDGLYGCRVNAAKPAQCGEFPYKWRNPDSLRTCAGLRALMRQLRAEEAAAIDASDAPEEPGSASPPAQAD